MTGAEPQQSKFKMWFFTGLGFGAGAVLMLAIVAGTIAWYLNRPKPWDGDAIRASFSEETYGAEDFKITGTNLDYIVTNATSKDYTLSTTDTFMILEKDVPRPSVSGTYKLQEPCFIPAANKVKCSVTVATDFDTTFGIDGFVIFDTINRYKVTLPKPSKPTPEDRKEAERTSWN